MQALGVIAVQVGTGQQRIGFGRQSPDDRLARKVHLATNEAVLGTAIGAVGDATESGSPCRGTNTACDFRSECVESCFALRSGLQLALPHHEHPPATPSEFALLASVPLFVRQGLFFPELGIRGRPPPESAAVCMPEAAMNEHNSAACRKHEIGPPRKGPAAKTVAEATPMQAAAHDEFEGCPMLPHALHAY